MIKLGISACFEYEDPGRPAFGPKVWTYIENDMARYVSRKGILPVLIPDVSSTIQQDILKEMDGIVLQGGVDLAPETYGETPIGRWKGDAYRDRYELGILDFVLNKGKPVLGICRGFQLMNVFFGGKLYQDIGSQKPDAKEHRCAEAYDKIKHPIHFEANGFLAKLYGGVDQPYVNSIHHQGIKVLGKDLEVYARSEDGLIEAFGYVKVTAGKVMGVQWHPEFSHSLQDELIDGDLLFEAFLQYCQPQKLTI